jgi:hypothetical protein
VGTPHSRKRLGHPFPPLPGAVPDVLFEPNGRLLIPYVSNAYESPTDVRTWERFACQAAGRDRTYVSQRFRRRPGQFERRSHGADPRLRLFATVLTLLISAGWVSLISMARKGSDRSRALRTVPIACSISAPMRAEA